jgi:hypothetical protein
MNGTIKGAKRLLRYFRSAMPRRGKTQILLLLAPAVRTQIIYQQEVAVTNRSPTRKMPRWHRNKSMTAHRIVLNKETKTTTMPHPRNNPGTTRSSS